MASKSSRNNIFLLFLISIFSCVIGILVGAGGLLVYQQSSKANTGVPNSNSINNSSPTNLPSLLSAGLVPTSDGFFISNNGKLIRLNGIEDDNQIDVSKLQSTSDRYLYIAIKGNDLPLANLRLLPYLAGIGVQLTLSQSGAMVNSVYEGSPAQLAGIKPGDYIVSADGMPVSVSIMFGNDLIGVMKEKITLQVVSGASTRTIQLPRTFRGTIINEAISSLFNQVSYILEQKSDYTLLHINHDIAPGVYRLEFQSNNVAVAGPLYSIGNIPGSTPTATPIPILQQKRLFVIN
jgi:membrane-associated protease RseP (regulator of RpoE activity)